MWSFGRHSQCSGFGSSNVNVLSCARPRTAISFHLKCPQYYHHSPFGQKITLSVMPISLDRLTWVRSSSDPAALELKMSSHAGKGKGKEVKGEMKRRGGERRKGFTGPAQPSRELKVRCFLSYQAKQRFSGSWPKPQSVKKMKPIAGNQQVLLEGLRIRKLLDLFFFFIII